MKALFGACRGCVDPEERGRSDGADEKAQAHPKYGNILASAGYDGKVFIWREQNGQWYENSHVNHVFSVLLKQRNHVGKKSLTLLFTPLPVCPSQHHRSRVCNHLKHRHSEHRILVPARSWLPPSMRLLRRKRVRPRIQRQQLGTQDLPRSRHWCQRRLLGARHLSRGIVQQWSAEQHRTTFRHRGERQSSQDLGLEVRYWPSSVSS